MYTQFRKRVEGQSPIRKCFTMPDKLNPLPDSVESGDIPTAADLGGQGEDKSRSYMNNASASISLLLLFLSYLQLEGYTRK